MLLSIVSFTNQVGLGTIATLMAIIACFWAIRAYVSGVQADEIQSLKDKVQAQGSEIVELRAKLAEEKARPDMTALQQLLMSEAEWKRAELKAVRQAAEEARAEHAQIVEALTATRDEHAQIVEALTAMKRALDRMVVDGGGAS